MEVSFVFGDPASPEAGLASHVICAEAQPREDLPEKFRDNESGPCSGGCGRELMWRPLSPDKPKICMQCCAAAIAKEYSEFENAMTGEIIEKVKAKANLQNAPAAVREAVGSGPLPAPATPEFAAFEEGAMFALGAMFAALHAEQTAEGGALANIGEPYWTALAALAAIIDEGVCGKLAAAEEAAKL